MSHVRQGDDLDSLRREVRAERMERMARRARAAEIEAKRRRAIDFALDVLLAISFWAFFYAGCIWAAL